MLRRREERWAAIFADDLIAGCEQLFAAYGGSPLTLPISIPIDDRGVVLLRPEGPLDAPRLPAVLRLDRPAPGHHTLAIERRDGGPLVVPGVRDAARPDAGAGAGAELRALVADVTRRGLVLSSGTLALAYDEDTARAYANALFLTLQRKLAKAPGADLQMP